MPRDKEGSQRKVFMLPAELVDRVAAFQREANLPSEVEAVRRLLEDALKFRDDWRTLTERFRRRHADARSLSDAARDVLVGHPLVTSMTFDRTSLTFTMADGITTTAEVSGEIVARDSKGSEFSTAPAFEYDETGQVKNWFLPF